MSTTKIENTTLPDKVKAWMRFFNISTLEDLSRCDEQTLLSTMELKDSDVLAIKGVLEATKLQLRPNGCGVIVNVRHSKNEDNMYRILTEVREYKGLEDVRLSEARDMARINMHACYDDKYQEIYLYATGAELSAIARYSNIDENVLEGRLESQIEELKRMLCNVRGIPYVKPTREEMQRRATEIIKRNESARSAKKCQELNVNEWTKAQLRFLGFDTVSELGNYDKETIQREGFFDRCDIRDLEEALWKEDVRFKKDGQGAEFNSHAEGTKSSEQTEWFCNIVREHWFFDRTSTEHIIGMLNRLCGKEYPEGYLYANGAKMEWIRRRGGLTEPEVYERVISAANKTLEYLCNDARVDYNEVGKAKLKELGNKPKNLDDAMSKLSAIMEGWDNEA